MALEKVAQLMAQAAGDSGVLSALQKDPARMRQPLQLSDAHVKALISAGAFSTGRQVMMYVQPAGAGTLLPPEGTGQFPRADELPPDKAPAGSTGKTPQRSGGTPHAQRPPQTDGPAPKANVPPAPGSSPQPRAGTPTPPTPNSPPGPGRTPTPPGPTPPVNAPAPPSGSTPSDQSPTTPSNGNSVCCEDRPQPCAPPAPCCAAPDCCCASTTAIVAIVAQVSTTAQTAITAITAIAGMD